ncbi:MAG TPA: sodium-dependent transporter, partial [Beutenbergiaceae bacterium]|nr:sodium-dependent transporter [Beutenbergiaceae bacterium]
VSSFKVGPTWRILLNVVTPVILGFMFVSEIITRIQAGYEEMPQSYVNTYGWGVAVGAIVIAIILSLLPWPKGVVETKGLNEQERRELV